MSLRVPPCCVPYATTRTEGAFFQPPMENWSGSDTTEGTASIGVSSAGEGMETEHVAVAVGGQATAADEVCDYCKTLYGLIGDLQQMPQPFPTAYNQAEMLGSKSPRPPKESVVLQYSAQEAAVHPVRARSRA